MGDLTLYVPLCNMCREPMDLEIEYGEPCYNSEGGLIREVYTNGGTCRSCVEREVGEDG